MSDSSTGEARGAEIRHVTTAAGDPAWHVRRYEDVRALLADTRLGKSHRDPTRASRVSQSAIFGNPVGNPDSEREDHARRRRFLSRSFSARRLESLRPRVQALTDQLLDDMAARKPPVDLHEALSFPLPVLVICELLGVPYEDRDDIRAWSDDLARVDDGERSRAGMMRLLAYMRELVQRRRGDEREDVITDLLTARDERGGLPEAEVVGQVAVLLFAGHLTTVSSIDKGVLLLLLHPAQRDAMTREPDLVPGAVEEVLRSSWPLPEPANAPPSGLPRYANVPLEVNGARIEPGDLVLLDQGGANMDPAVFPDPHRFDVARDDEGHVSFGHGPYFCIGAPLARMELQVVFGTIFRRFPNLRLAVPLEQVQARTGRLTSGLTELPVEW